VLVIERYFRPANNEFAGNIGNIIKNFYEAGWKNIRRRVFYGYEYSFLLHSKSNSAHFVALSL